MKKLSCYMVCSIFNKPKDRLAVSQVKGIPYKVSCKTCDFHYVGESKTSPGIREV